MHTTTYLAVVAPGLVAAAVFACCCVFAVDGLLKDSDLVTYYVPTTVDYSKSMVFAALLPFGFKLVGFMRHTFSFSENTLFDLRKTNFDRFYLPALEEVLKFAFVYYLAHPKCLLDPQFPVEKRPVGLSIKEVAVAALFFSLAALLPALYENCPVFYTAYYKRFLELHRLWLEHERSSACQKTDTAMLLAESLKKGSETAHSSNNVENTIIAVDNENTFLFPSTFTVSQPQPRPKNGPLVKFKSTSVLNSATVASPICNPLEPHLASYCDLVERLYSVSPKNTYHSNQATMYALAAIDKDQSHKAVSLHETSSYSAIDPSLMCPEEHAREELFTGAPESPAVISDDTSNLTEREPVPLFKIAGFLALLRKYRGMVLWFRWALPIGEQLLDSEFCLRTNSRPDRRIKKKLSLYTINSKIVPKETDLLCSSKSVIGSRSSSTSSYGTFDLENQKDETPVANVGYTEFFRFVQRYFDLNLCSLSNTVHIDPIFVKFSVLSTEFKSVHFILFKLREILWNFSTLMVFASPFIVTSLGNIWGAFAAILVLKFFNSNYLNSQWEKPYAAVLVAEVAVNSAFFLGCIFYYVRLSL